MPVNEIHVEVEDKVLQVLKKLTQLLARILLMLLTKSEENLSLIKSNYCLALLPSSLRGKPEMTFTDQEEN